MNQRLPSDAPSMAGGNFSGAQMNLFHAQLGLPGNQVVNGQIPAQNMFDGIVIPVRGRGRGRGRGRARGSRARGHYRRTSSEESDDDFVPNTGSAVNDIRRSTRSHQARNIYTDDSNDEAENSESSEPVTSFESHAGEGPMIESILSRSTEENKPSFLVKWNQSSYIHASLVTEAELKAGSHTNPMLKKFDSICENNGELVSDVGPNLVDPIWQPINLFNFYVDRIVNYRRLDDQGQDYLAENLDYAHYIPGIPSESIPPLDQVMSYESPFHDEENYIERPMRDDGVCVLDDESEKESASEAEATNAVEMAPPDNVELLIKWQGSKESDATWENPKRLKNSGDLFGVANINHMNRLIDLFWSRTLHRQKKLPEIPITKDIKIEFKNRLETLTDNQKNCVLKLLDTRREHQSAVILGEKGSGRVLSVVAFLEILRQVFRNRHPTMILVQSKAWVWVQAIHELSSLYWVEYNGDVSNRLVVRNHELVGIKDAKFDVLITDLEIFEKDIDTLGKFEWGSIIIDNIHETFDFEKLLSTKIAHKIFLCDNNDSKLSLMPLPYSRISMPEYPISYTENLVFVGSNISSQVHFKLRGFFKNKATRHTACNASHIILLEILRSYTHPFLVPSIQKSIIQDHKNRLGIAPNSSLQPAEYMKLLINSSSKISKLFELINKNEVNVVVSDHFSTLRIVSQVCQQYGIPSGLIESPVATDRIFDNFDCKVDSNDTNVHSPFERGVILTTRNFASPIFDYINISKIFIVDIGRNFDADISLIRFLSRKKEIPVYRFLTWDSVEISIFNRYIADPLFNYESLTPIQSEHLLKIAALTTQQAREANTKVPSEFRTFRYPIDVKDIAAIDQAVNESEEISSDTSFWDTVFAHTRVQHVKQSIWKNKDAIRFLDSFSVHGIGQWNKIATEVNRLQEEVTVFGRAILLYLMSNLDANELCNSSLLNSILWFETYPAGFENQFDENASFWQNIAFDDPTLQLPLFNNTTFSRQLHNKREYYIKLLEQNWIVQAYLNFRHPPYLPTRFCSQFNDPLSQATFCYDLLHKYLEFGQNWQNVSAAMSNWRISPEEIEKKFSYIYSCIQMDLFSFILHRIKDPTALDEYRKDPYLKPIIQMLEKGPFSPLWNEHEMSLIIKTLSEFSIPSLQTGEKEWNEFHSLTQIATKTTEQIGKFTSKLLENVMASTEIHDVILDARANPLDQRYSDRMHQITITATNLNLLRKRLSILQHIRGIIQDGSSIVFKPQASLPPNWDESCDLALLQGICQFGFSKFTKIYAAVPIPEEQERHDHVMLRDLNNFQQFLSNPQLSVHRLKFIILSNRNVKRKIVFYSEVHQIKFKFSKEEHLKKSSVKGASGMAQSAPKIDPAKGDKISPSHPSEYSSTSQLNRPIGNLTSTNASVPKSANVESSYSGHSSYQSVGGSNRPTSKSKASKENDAYYPPTKVKKEQSSITTRSNSRAAKADKNKNSQRKSVGSKAASLTMAATQLIKNDPSLSNVQSFPPASSIFGQSLPPSTTPVDSKKTTITQSIFGADLQHQDLLLSLPKTFPTKNQAASPIFDQNVSSIFENAPTIFQSSTSKSIFDSNSIQPSLPPPSSVFPTEATTLFPYGNDSNSSSSQSNNIINDSLNSMNNNMSSIFGNTPPNNISGTMNNSNNNLGFTNNISSNTNNSFDANGGQPSIFGFIDTKELPLPPTLPGTNKANSSFSFSTGSNESSLLEENEESSSNSLFGYGQNDSFGSNDLFNQNSYSSSNIPNDSNSIFNFNSNSNGISNQSSNSSTGNLFGNSFISSNSQSELFDQNTYNQMGTNSIFGNVTMPNAAAQQSQQISRTSSTNMTQGSLTGSVSIPSNISGKQRKQRQSKVKSQMSLSNNYSTGVPYPNGMTYQMGGFPAQPYMPYMNQMGFNNSNQSNNPQSYMGSMVSSSFQGYYGSQPDLQNYNSQYGQMAQNSTGTANMSNIGSLNTSNASIQGQQSSNILPIPLSVSPMVSDSQRRSSSSNISNSINQSAGMNMNNLSTSMMGYFEDDKNKDTDKTKQRKNRKKQNDDYTFFDDKDDDSLKIRKNRRDKRERKMISFVYPPLPKRLSFII